MDAVYTPNLESIARCFTFYRLLPMNIAHYETIYGGSLPLQDRIAMTYTTDLSEEQNEVGWNIDNKDRGLPGSDAR